MRASLAKGFTIVELIIVISVIGILAAVTMVGYNSIQAGARDKAVLSDVDSVESEITRYAVKHGGQYGLAVEWYSEHSTNTQINFTPSTGNIIDVVATTTDYCIRGYNPAATTYNSLATAATKGSSTSSCAAIAASPEATGEEQLFIQTITSANCPTNQTRAVDARDKHTYWVQKLADGKCWMLTNLAYAGGGNNTYGDVKTLTDGTNLTQTYSSAYYSVISSTTNYTVRPNDPSSSTDGTGQYGYYYTWCAAMGGQATAACASATTPAPDPDITICPAGWRLPTGDPTTGEFVALNAAVNSSSVISNAGLRSAWLAQYGGYRTTNGTIYYKGSNGHYWSSTQASSGTAYPLVFTNVYVAFHLADHKGSGLAVRCVAK